MRRSALPASGMLGAIAVTVLASLLSVLGAGWGQPTVGFLLVCTAATATGTGLWAAGRIGGPSAAFAAFVLATCLALVPGAWIVLLVGAVTAALAVVSSQHAHVHLAPLAATAAAAAVLGPTVTPLRSALALPVALAVGGAVSALAGHRLPVASLVRILFAAAGGMALGTLAADQPVLAALVVLGAGAFVVRRPMTWRSDDASRLEALAGDGAAADRWASAVIALVGSVVPDATTSVVLIDDATPLAFTGSGSSPVTREPLPAGRDHPDIAAALADTRRGALPPGLVIARAVPDADDPHAVVLVRRPASAAPLARRQLQLADVALSHARQTFPGLADPLALPSWLADGQAQASAEAMVALRRAAARLADDARHMDGADPISRIVDDLQGLEHAVAMLIGASTGQSEDAPVPAQRRSEWTSTGSLGGSR